MPKQYRVTVSFCIEADSITDAVTIEEIGDWARKHGLNSMRVLAAKEEDD